VNDSARSGGLADIFVDEDGRRRLDQEASNLLSGLRNGPNGPILTPSAIEEVLKLLEEIAPDLPRGETAIPPADGAPAEGQSLEEEASLIHGDGQQANLRGGASGDVLNLSGGGMLDDYFSVISVGVGVAVAAAAGAKQPNAQTSGPSYRRYGARNVVSLEQRLRVWQDDKFGLRSFEKH
jgi:hypothetical protein